MEFFKQLQADREIDVKFWGKHPELRKQLVDDAYPDKAHFIYELLQNAEDALATNVLFELHEDKLIFIHNGKVKFSYKDVEAITDVSKSGKSNSVETIGKFGIGFKSVFKYTESPKIYCGNISFEIINFVYPREIKGIENLGDLTRFEFLFNVKEKIVSESFEEIALGLRRISEDTLNFLSNLEKIDWTIRNKSRGVIFKKQHSEFHIEVNRNIDENYIVSRHFLKFVSPIEGTQKQYVAIAYELDFLPSVTQFNGGQPFSSQFKIIPCEGRVSVYFPAENERSGLRFHMHAPFVPELSRASVKKTPANDPLFDRLAELAASSLMQIRNLKLLSVEFLGVLPNNQDQLNSSYHVVRNAILQAMIALPLTPTHFKSHAPSRILRQSNASLKALLSDDDIKLLIDYEDDEGRPVWAPGAIRGSNSERFLDSLNIETWDIDSFIQVLVNKISCGKKESGPPYNLNSAEIKSWFASKSTGWHQQLYSLLFDYINQSQYQREKRIQILKPLALVRLSDGSYEVGDKCFFQGYGEGQHGVFPWVDSSVYRSGKNKSEQENSKRFLQEVGVREVGEAEQIEEILKYSYSYEKTLSDEKNYIEDLLRFIFFVEKRPQEAKMFSSYFILLCEDGKLRRPSSVYIDKPFQDTSLKTYYKMCGEQANVNELSKKYNDIGIAIPPLIMFSEAVGAITKINLIEVKCSSNEKKDYLYAAAGGRINEYSIDRDYYFPLINKVIDAKNLEISRLIWRTMCRDSSAKLSAVYRKSKSGETRRAPSLILNWLTKRAWVPQGNGTFVKPAEASRSLLPDGFPFDPGWPWIKAINFGEDLTRKSEELRKKQEAAKELGFKDSESLERARRFIALPLEEQERILANELFKIEDEACLPEQAPINPERRAAKVGEQAILAPTKQSEVRSRTIVVGREEVKQEAVQYLRNQYLGPDGDMICQICKKSLPFKLSDGTDYFEKIEFLQGFEKAHFQNYLALCPNHAAMFLYANEDKENLNEAFSGERDGRVRLMLAGKDEEVYFTRTHIFDLRKILEIEKKTGAVIEKVDAATKSKISSNIPQKTCPYCHATIGMKNYENHIKNKCPKRPKIVSFVQNSLNKTLNGTRVVKNNSIHRCRDCGSPAIPGGDRCYACG